MAENGRREGDTSECRELRQLINSFVLKCTNWQLSTRLTLMPRKSSEIQTHPRKIGLSRTGSGGPAPVHRLWSADQPPTRLRPRITIP